MKFKNKIYSIAIFMAVIMLTACDKNEIAPLQLVVSNQAKIAVVNAVPGSPNIDIMSNGAKINGSTLAYAVRFPAIQYSVLMPGNATIKSVVNTPAILPTTAPNIAFGTELSSSTFNFVADKNYVVFVTGSPGATTTGTVIEDVFPAVANLKAHVKFVNAMPDGANMDLLSGIIPAGASAPTTSSALFSNITRNTGTDFVAIDVPLDGATYQFQLKITGGGANAGVTLNLAALPGRLYTVYARGFNTTNTIPGFTPARTVTAAPGISVFSNR
jgi:hypothetical protein